MSFWQVLGRFAFSDKGETISKVSDTTSVSFDGTTYTRMGSTTVGSDGSVLTQTRILLAPFVERGITDTHLATDFIDLGAQLRLLDLKRDLLLCKSAYLHDMLSFP